MILYSSLGSVYWVLDILNWDWCMFSKMCSFLLMILYSSLGSVYWAIDILNWDCCMFSKRVLFNGIVIIFKFCVLGA